MSDYDFDDDLDAAAFEQLDQLEAVYAADPSFAARSRINVEGLKQRDLFGGTAQMKPPPKPKNAVASSSRAGYGNAQVRVRVDKIWDRSSFAVHGWSKKAAAALKGKAKGKKRAYASDEEGWEEEDEVQDDDQDLDPVYLDKTFDPHAKALPIQWEPDEEAAQSWVYPVQEDKPLRTYQYNIVHSALFDNTLVSLPTGLGKTFIAAVVMLNFYRWYPKGKIIFMAPTRPLVTQQIQACHYIAGIPQSDCVELTGQTAPIMRNIAWGTKRVIYCTPQTFENDLAKGRVDPRDVVCVVVDEAHRASGDYAYCGVVRYLMSRNPHFRLLALTATPGANADAVQKVVDNLHIGKLEIRTDESMDILSYIHKKAYDLQIVSLGPRVSSMRDRFGALMLPYMNPLVEKGLIYIKDPPRLTRYMLTLAGQKLHTLPGGSKANSRFYPKIKTLGVMAAAMEYLMGYSISSFDSRLKNMEGDCEKALVQRPEFLELLRELNVIRAHPKYVAHPKMERMRFMCIQHFLDVAAEETVDGEAKETRVMIFCSYREVVDEIVECLNRPIDISGKTPIKATCFVGQGKANGKGGQSQKHQIETIRKFKQGTYNVLVATSIGEEGLDIGEIDLIICYEASKSPIRMLQRVGRTGRARDGKIIVLMTEGHEEKNWEKANEAYTEVQRSIVSGMVYELYSDGDRLLPARIKPVCDKRVITAQPLDLSTMTMAGHARVIKKAASKEEKAAKASEKANKNKPVGLMDGFITAGKFAAKEKLEKTASQSLRERKLAALLTPEQQEWLRSHWQFSGTQKIRPVRFDEINPRFDPHTSGSALRIPQHSSSHLGLLSLRKNISRLQHDEETMVAWRDEMTEAYRSGLITRWPDLKKGTSVPFHKSLRPSQPPSSPDSVFSEFTAPTFLRAAASPSPPPSPSPPVPIRSKTAPAPASVHSSSVRRIVIASSPIPLPSPSPPKRARTSYHPEPAPLSLPPPTIDYYGVLSSDEDDDVPPPAPLLPFPAALESSQYGDHDFNISDFDMIDAMVESKEVIADEMEGKTNEAVSKEMVLVIEDESDEIEDVEEVAHGVTTPAAQVRIQPVIEVDPYHISDSEPEDELLSSVPARHVASTTRSAVPLLLEPSAPVRPLSTADYSFDDFDEDAFDQAEAEALAQAGPMLPPAILIPSVVKPVYKSRPRHHIIPDSDSSSHVLPVDVSPSVAESPLVVIRPNVMKRQQMIVASSSPNVARAVAGPSKLRHHQQSPPPLANKLQRGRPAPMEECEDIVDEVEEPPVQKRKKKAKKLNANTNPIFDLQAVNSSSEDDPAMSGSVSSLDSDDRRFVASDDSCMTGDATGMGQFYRDSLNTQPPAAFGRRGFDHRLSNRAPVHRSIERGTPRDGSQWSYDSFCVADDDDIELEESSEL